MGYAYTSKREKQGEETKQLKKKEKEVQWQKAERKNPERVIKVNEWEKIYKREGESTEIRQWMKEKTGGEKKTLTGVRRTAIIRVRVSMVVKIHCLGKKK